ncbi:hypothetical protein V5O48_013062 [Marasmius crinis-equi]|uniref:Uncharacterized protein n=1 Tax=Marasmius crinis-equi TaxID=585013 RepID=A0ABR3F138_9AGAR
MAPPPAFKGLRQKWLLDQLEGYEEAIKAGQGPDFLGGLVKRYVRRFPQNRFAEDQEPPEEWMEMEESDLPAKEDLVPPKRRPGQSIEDHMKEIQEFDALANKEIATLSQVKSFMRRRVANGVFSFEKGGEAWNIVMAKLAGVHVTKPGRQRTAFNVWAKQNESLIDSLVEKKRQELLEAKKVESEERKDSDDKKGSDDKDPEGAKDGEAVKGTGAEGVEMDGEKGEKDESRVEKGGEKGEKDESSDKYSVSIRQLVVKGEFEKLPADEQEHWKNLAKEEHAKRKREFQELQEAGYSEDPGKRQAAIERFPVWIMEVLQEASKATSLHMSVFAGGPMPAAGGELKMIGVHVGRTMGPAGQSFGVAYQGAVESVVTQIYGEFLRDCFSKEDCEAMSLSSATRGDLKGLYEGNDAISINDIPILPQKQEEGAASAPNAAGASSLASSEVDVTTSSASGAPEAGGTSATSSAISGASIEVATDSASAHVSRASSLFSSGGSKSAIPTTSSTSKPSPSTNTDLPSVSAEPAIATVPKTQPPVKPSLSKPSKPSAVPSRSKIERSLPTGGLKRPFSVAAGDCAPSTSSAASKSSKLSTSRDEKPPRDLPIGRNSLIPPRRPAPVHRSAEYPPSTINTTALRRRGREKTYASMTTGGHAPPVLPHAHPDLPKLAAQITRQEIVARQALSPGWETDGSLGRTSRERKSRNPSMAKARRESLHSDSGPGGKGSASSPIRIDSPVSSRAPTPDLDLPLPPPVSARDTSPSASSVASAVSPQLRPARVRASSPPASSPVPQMPPSTQPHCRVAAQQLSHVEAKEEPIEDESGLLRAGSKRTKPEREDLRRGKRRRVSPDLDASEDEISAHLEDLPPSSPLASASSRRKVLSHVEVSRGPSTGSRVQKSRSKTSGTPASGGKSKYYAAVDPSSIDTNEYAVQLPDDAPRYMHLTMEMCSGVQRVEGDFIDVLRLWVEFEEESGFLEKGKLTTQGRPQQVAVWISHGRRANFSPDITDLHEYGRQVREWWWNCAPEWRQVKGMKELRRGRGGSWEDLRVSGVNGLTSVVAALAWWMDALARLRRDKPRDRQFYERELEHFVMTLKDVTYSLGQLVG